MAQDNDGDSWPPDDPIRTLTHVVGGDVTDPPAAHGSHPAASS